MSNASYEAHDAQWLVLAAAVSKTEQTLSSRTDILIHVAGMRSNRSYVGGYLRDGEYLSQSKALTAALAWCATHLDDFAPTYSGRVSAHVESYGAAVLAADASRSALSSHEAAYTGWSRYWLVTSSNGLIHRSMNCPTCNKGRQSTMFALLPSLSGAEFTAAVEALGPSLCSVCFPEAPVEVVDGAKLPSRITNLLFSQSGQSGFFAELAKYNAAAGQRAEAAAKRAETKRLAEARRIARYAR